MGLFAIPRTLVAQCRHQFREPLHLHGDRRRIIFVIVHSKTRAHLGGSFHQRHGHHHRAFQFLFGRRAHGGPAAADHVLDEIAHGRQFRGVTLYWLGLAHHHDGTVVDRVARGRRRAYDAVEKRHAQAKWRATRQRFHQAACRGAVEEEFVADTDVVCWDDEGLAIGDEGEMADKGFIENGVDQLAVVAAALRLAPDSCSFGRREVAHSRRLAGPDASQQEPIWISQ